MGEGLRVHEGEHEDLVRRMVDRDAGDQPVRAELRLEERPHFDVGVVGARGDACGLAMEVDCQVAGTVPSFRR